MDILRYFDYEHLPPKLQAISKPFHAMAHEIADQLGVQDKAEQLMGLHKLLEAKDCIVRSVLPRRD